MKLRCSFLILLSLSLVLILLFLIGFSPAFVPARAADNTEVSGTILTHTQWTRAESPYVVVGEVTVNPGIRLTIQPGVEVKFAGNYGLLIQGTLEARGTTTQPIYFTSNHTTPATGDWGGIDLMAGSQSSRIEYAVVEYGGNASWRGFNCSPGALCVNTSSFTLNQSTIRYSATRGAVLAQSSATFTNNTFSQNAKEAIRLHQCKHTSGACRPLIQGNIFVGNESAIYHQAAVDPILGGNRANQNSLNGYVMGSDCEFEGRHTWYAGDLTYVVRGWCDIGAWDNAPLTLTVQAGTVVKLDSTLALRYASAISFTAGGDPDHPVIFTSLQDDTIGGDTNNDGAATSPAPKDWGAVMLEGAHTTALFKHTIFRYGGAGDRSPQVYLFNGAKATVQNSDIGDSEVCMRANVSASLDLENSRVHDCAYAGVSMSNGGQIGIHHSRFENNRYGILVDGASPQVSDNVFVGNTSGVQITCVNCTPLISPDNRFFGAGQTGISNQYPRDNCVNARENWWGSVTGPADLSSAQDACGLGDNPGSGTSVSDGVDYSPWKGGITRPVIAHPACGVTALERPIVAGRASAGDLIALYDGSQLIGQAHCRADHIFVMTPTVTLTDGVHLLSAVARRGAESSLPSAPLTLTVDSSLDYDPAGIKVIYQYHHATYTQPLRDASGCATATGDLSTALQIRPGSAITILVPIRKSFITPTQETAGIQPPAAVPVQPGIPDVPIEYRITNYGTQPVQDIYLVPNGSQAGLQEDYRHAVNMQPGEVRLLNIEAGIYDVVAILADGSISKFDLGRQLNSSQSEVYDNQDQRYLTILNTVDGQKFTRVLLSNDFRQLGPNMLKPGSTTLDSGEALEWRIPVRFGYTNHYYILAQREDGTWYFWANQPVDRYGTEVLTRLLLNKASRTIRILSSVEVCGIYMTRKGGAEGDAVWGQNLIGLLGVNKLQPFTPYEIKVVEGDYDLMATDCAGHEVPIDKRLNVHPEDGYLWDIGSPCDAPGQIRWTTGTGSVIDRLGLTTLLPQFFIPLDWSIYAASRVAGVNWGSTPTAVLLELCNQKKKVNAGVGRVTIDPDGYVYAARIGLAVRIPGATVTCDQYDDEMGIWSRWPAELWDNQINPQITAGDGYYAFFVPPGFYRVSASAPAYRPHTSPVIQVIQEVVHYNIPLESSGQIYLPLVRKR